MGSINNRNYKPQRRKQMKKIFKISTIVLLSITIYLSVGYHIAQTQQNVYETKRVETLLEKFLDYPTDKGLALTHAPHLGFTFNQIAWLPNILAASVIWTFTCAWRFVAWFFPALGNLLWWLIARGGFYNTFGWWGILVLVIILICVIWWKKILDPAKEYFEKHGTRYREVE